MSDNKRDTQLAFYVLEEPKPAKEGDKAVTFRARMAHSYKKDPVTGESLWRGMIFDVAVLGCDELTASMIIKGQAFIAHGRLETNPVEKGDKTYVNPKLTVFNKEDDPQIYPVDKLGRDTPCWVPVKCTFVSQPQQRGKETWVNYILRAISGKTGKKDAEGKDTYFEVKIEGSSMTKDVLLDSNKDSNRYRVRCDLYTEVYNGKETLKAVVREAEEIPPYQPA